MPAGQQTQASWVGIVQQLADHLQANEDRLGLLLQINRSMNDYGLPVVEYLSSPLREFARISQANEAHFYVDSGDVTLLLCTTGSGEAVKSIDLSALSLILSPDQKDPKVFAKSELGQIEPLFPNATCLFILPVWLPPDRAWPSADKRFGVVFLEDTQYDHRLTPFQDQAIQSFAHSVINYLSIGIRVHLKGWRTSWFENLTKTFFELDLEPYACFKELAKRIPKYLPEFGPFGFKSQPEVSIIIHEREENNYLTIIASSARDQIDNTRLKFDDSVVGIFFEDMDLPYILGNPRQDPLLKSRYKGYAEEINSELAAPIKEVHSRKPSAVINLESKSHQAFRQLHVDALLYLCNILRPMFSALYDRIVERQLQQEAILKAQRSYWNTVGSVLQHNTNSQLASIRMGIDNARKAIELDKAETADQILAPIPDTLATVSEEIKEFSNKIHQYSVYGRYSVNEQILEAIAKIEQMMTRIEQWVQITYAPSEDFDTFCSPILAMHLYNLLDNSVFWIYDRINQKPEHKGEISITVRLGPMPVEGQTQELNQTCQITITDNGSGCPPETLSKLLRRPVASQRRDGLGMGHAVYAAASYVQSLGGKTVVDSEPGEWFRTTINLPLYNEKLHRPKSDIQI